MVFQMAARYDLPALRVARYAAAVEPTSFNLATGQLLAGASSNVA